MFEKSSVFLLLDEDGAARVKKLETDRETQEGICRVFAAGVEHMTHDKIRIQFDGSYVPDEDECLAITGFQLPSDITEALKKPIGTPPFRPVSCREENIRAVFVGEEGAAAFQRFRRDQYIRRQHFNLMFDRDTFVAEKRCGITVTDCVDCVCLEGDLLFDSYFFTRQIFDLSGHYRSATQGEVEAFVKSGLLDLEDGGLFVKQADSAVRRRIGSILDNKILENYSPETIRRIGKREGVKIEVRNGKIFIPREKKEMKVVLSFLDEAVYKGAFSKSTYLANSKRRV